VLWNRAEVSAFGKLSKKDIEGAEAAVALPGGDKGDDMFPVAA